MHKRRALFDQVAAPENDGLTTGNFVRIAFRVLGERINTISACREDKKMRVLL